MSTTQTVPVVSVEEYLNTSYEQDMEFVDGELIARGMPTVPHSRLQKLLLFWFAQFEKDLGFETLQEVRTQIIERARYRIPDIMLCALPGPQGRICDLVPWAIIEVLSPDDSLAGTRDRFLDYQQIGVYSLVLMDPEKYIAYEFRDGSLIAQPFKTLGLPGGLVDFDTEALFEQLRSKLFPK